MRNELFVKTFQAEGAVGASRIVKFGSSDRQVSVGAAGTDKAFGVADSIGGANGEMVDVIMGGVALVVYGGNVAAGDLLASDATGAAVVAIAGDRVVGVAMQSGVAGDIGSVALAASAA